MLTETQKNARWPYVLVAVFSFLLYANTIPNEYNLDDELVTVNHPVTSQGISAIPQIFTSPYYEDAAGNRYEYRPVVLTTFAIEHSLWGDNPHLSHLVNVLLYVLTTVILFLCLSQLFHSYNYLLPLVITLLFAAHPLHTEVVASIKNRDEILCLLNGLIALWLSIKFGRTGKWKFLPLVVIFFLLALMSKRSIIPFSLIVPLGAVLFTDIKKLHLVSMSLLLLLSSIFFIPTYQASIFVIYASSMLLFPLVLRWWMRTEKPLGDLQGWFNSLVISFNADEEVSENQDNDVLPSGKWEWNTKYLILISTLTVVITCTVIYLDFKWLLLCWLLILCGLVPLLKSDGMKAILWNITAITLAADLFYQTYFLSAGLMFFLSYLLFKGYEQKLFLYAAILLLAVTILLDLDIMESGAFIALTIGSAWLFSRIKLQLISIGFYIFITVVVLGFTKFEWKQLYFPLMGLLLLYLSQRHKKNTLLHARYLLLLLPVIALFIFVENYEAPPNFMGSQLNPKSTYQVVEQMNETVPASGRELNFLEMPLKKDDPVILRLGTAFNVLGRYLKLLVIPHPLSFYYGYKEVQPVPMSNIWAILSLLIYLALFVLALVMLNREKVLAFGVLAYLMSISVFSNFFAPVAGLMGDRLTYVASLGFCIALGYFILRVFKVNLKESKPWKDIKLPIYAVILILVAYSGKTVARNFEWKDHLTLMGGDIKHLKQSAHAHYLYGIQLMKSSFNQPNVKAIQYRQRAAGNFMQSLEIYRKNEYAWADLGRAYISLNQDDKALVAFKNAIRYDSAYIAPMIDVSAILIQQDKLGEAEQYLQLVLEHDSNNYSAYLMMSRIRFTQKDYIKSIEYNRKALELSPSAYDPLVNIGKAYFTMGEKQNAVEYFEKAYKINPTDYNLVSTLAELHQELGHTEKATFYKVKANSLQSNKGL